MKPSSDTFIQLAPWYETSLFSIPLKILVDQQTLLFLVLFLGIPLLAFAYIKIFKGQKSLNQTYQRQKLFLMGQFFFGVPFLLSDSLLMAAAFLLGLEITKGTLSDRQISIGQFASWFFFLLAVLLSAAFLKVDSYSQLRLSTAVPHNISLLFLVSIALSAAATLKLTIKRRFTWTLTNTIESLLMLIGNTYLFTRLFNVGLWDELGYFAGVSISLGLVGFAFYLWLYRGSQKPEIFNPVADLAEFTQKIIEEKVLVNIYFCLKLFGPLSAGLLSMKMTGNVSRSLTLITITLIGTLIWGLCI